MYYSPDQERFLAASSAALLQLFPPDYSQAESRIADLTAAIQYQEWRYYVKNDPVLSDTEFDQLFKQLKQIEADFPEFAQSDSPTQRVSSDLATDSEAQAVHLKPMLSLANSYDATDLLDFDAQVRKLTGRQSGEAIAYVVEPKFDGGSIALVYENDVLTRGATRGNGTIGEDMTANAKVILGIPLSAKFSENGLFKVEVRGEALIRKDRFEQINAQRLALGLQQFANPRNAATGGLRTKDPADTAIRNIEAFIYSLGFAADAQDIDQSGRFDTHAQSIALLQNLGFPTPTEATKVCDSIQTAIDFVQLWEQKRDSYAYEIDGMVLKVNDLHLQQLCGFTSHHPRWAIAFKFKARQATTKMLQVDFQVGKTGSITPVARLQPVALAGVTVRNVSLHNEDFIRGKDIRIGDQVLVERAGDVIPYIVKSLPDLRDGSEKVILFPTHCPSCDAVLNRAEKEAVWRCENVNCEAQILQRIQFHVSKHAMDIEGCGPALIEKFYALGWITSLADIYRLSEKPISGLEGFGKKSADNLFANIEKAKKNPIQRLLSSLSIHHLGRKGAQLLAAEVGHVLELAHWDLERYTQIKEFGPVLARNVHAFFSQPDNIYLLKDMESLGVNLNQTDADRPAIAAATGIFAQKSILFTGSLQRFTREEAEKAAAALGANIASSVSKNLSILVVGEKAGSKLEKAQKIKSIQILSEDEFFALIEGV